MKHYKFSAIQAASTGFTDMFVISKADWVTNATTAHVLDTLAVGDLVWRVATEVITGIAGPTATMSVGITGALTLFTPAVDISAGTSVPYAMGTRLTVGTGFIAATSAGAVTTALTNATSGVVGPYNATSVWATHTATSLVANAILSDDALTAGEVRIWANISRKATRDIIQ
jgi:hypothetical protein